MKRRTKSDYLVDCISMIAPGMSREIRFHDIRKWRLDCGWNDTRVAVEIQGGVWSRGAHGRGTGIMRDYEKINWAQVLGWVVLQFTPEQIEKEFGTVATMIKSAMNRQRMGQPPPAMRGASPETVSPLGQFR